MRTTWTIAIGVALALLGCGGKGPGGGSGGAGGRVVKTSCPTGCSDPDCVLATPLGPGDQGSEGLFGAGSAALALPDGTALLVEERWTAAVPRGLLLLRVGADGSTLDEATLGAGAAPHLAQIGDRTLLAYSAPDGSALFLSQVKGVSLTQLQPLDVPGTGAVLESVQAAGAALLVSAHSDSGTSVAWLASDGALEDGWFTFPTTSPLPAAVVPTSTGAAVFSEEIGATHDLSVRIVTRATGAISPPGTLLSAVRFGSISAVATANGMLVFSSKQVEVGGTTRLALSMVRVSSAGAFVKEVSPAGGISQLVLTAEGFASGGGFFAVAPGDDPRTGPASVTMVWSVDPDLAKVLPPPTHLPLGLGKVLAFGAAEGDYDLFALDAAGPVRVRGYGCYTP